MGAAAFGQIGAGAAGIGDLLGALFGSSSSNSSSTTGQSNTTGMSSEQLQNLLNTLQQMQTSQQGQTSQTQTLTPQMTALMNSLPNMLTPFNQNAYVAGQTQNIEASGNAQANQVNNEMASRGLSTSPVAATAEQGVRQNTLNQVNQMQQQAPLIGAQQNLANIAAATNLLGTVPRTTTGATSQTGTQTGTTAQTGTTTGSTNTSGTTNVSNNTNSTATQNGLLGSLFSDERMKKDIKPLPHEEALNKLMKLKPSSWKWKSDGSSDSGVVAQDVEKVFPKAVLEDAGTGMKKVDMNALMPHIIASIQALHNSNKGV